MMFASLRTFASLRETCIEDSIVFQLAFRAKTQSVRKDAKKNLPALTTGSMSNIVASLQWNAKSAHK